MDSLKKVFHGKKSGLSARFGILFLLLIFLSSTVPARSAPSDQIGTASLEGEVLVKFRKGIGRGEQDRFHEEAGADLVSDIEALEVTVVRSKRGEPAAVLAERYRKNPFVASAEPGITVQSADTLNPPAAATIPGAAQSFTATYSDPGGFQNLTDASLLIAGGGHNQWVHYAPGTNRFSLAGAAGSCAPGQAATLSTGFLVFNCAGSSASGSGTTLTVIFNLTPQPSFSGIQYRLAIIAADQTGANSGRVAGIWTVDRTPGADGLTPSSAATPSGLTQTFTAAYSDPDGFQNLTDASLLIAGGGQNQGVRYSPATNRFTLIGAGGSCLPGQAATLSTGFLSFNCAGSSASGSGTTLTVAFSLTPRPPFAGVQYRLGILTADQAGVTHANEVGSWTIPIRLAPVASGLVSPIGLANAGDGSGRLFVVEQRGTIKIIKDGAVLGSFFLDIRDRIISGGELGLLGLAFHPDFSQNRRFYVNYTSQTGGLHTVISEFTVGTAPDLADKSTERILLTIPQPFTNHNGGNLVFGPDGFLYIGMGDGGSGNDPQGNGQNLATLLGKMLRIDVDRKDPGKEYASPPDNPFIGTGGARPEIWAFGFRNPWRFSIDFPSGLLYAGDVGQSAREEIDVVRRGRNYGWKIMEGTICTPGVNPNCNQTGLELPIVDYPRTEGTTVVGGFVYRGSAMPGLIGNYLYGDFGSGRIWTLRYDGAAVSGQRIFLSTGRSISSFGRDEPGEIYVVDIGGEILKITP